jgi:hypothetical protein
MPARSAASANRAAARVAPEGRPYRNSFALAEANEQAYHTLQLESDRHIDKVFNFQNRSRNFVTPDDVDTSGGWRARRMSSIDFG